MKPTDILLAIGQDETGATAVEYGLIASLVVIAALTAIISVANESNAMWGKIESKSTTAMEAHN